MAMFSMKYNASGNYDGTAYSAMMDMAKPGEIWTSNIGKEFLVLKNHGTFCSVLNLKDEPPRNADECIEIISRQVRWTNTAMVGYLFNQTLCEYVKTIPEEEFVAIMDDVAARLGVTITVQKEETPAPELEAMKARAESLYQAMEKMQVKHACELEKMDEMHKKDTAEITSLQQKVEELQARAPQADPAGAVYKQLYHELLDRIIAGGGMK